jgi:DNA-nicking Smr family endonuclease
MARSRRGGLSEEDRALWEKVKASVTPLEPAPRSRDLLQPPEPPSPPPPRPTPPRARTPARPSYQAPQRPPQPQPRVAAADRKEARAIASGRTHIDARLDLHGMRQAEAHRALSGFLIAAQAQGARLVLVITGRGDPEARETSFSAEPPRGVLRASVPSWLGEPALQSVVVGWSAAHRRHGGDGALYVRLRRRR